MTWHPLLACDERTPGVWTLVDSRGVDYGEARIVRIGNEVGYTTTMQGHPAGRYTNLRAAVEAIHAEFIRSHTPGFKGYPKFDSHLNDER